MSKHLTESEKRELTCRERFLCQCGASLTYEVNGQNQFRVVCSKIYECWNRLEHYEAGQWCSTREEAEQLWRVLKIMQQS